MGVYLPQGYEPLTAQHIVDQYTKIIDEIDQNMYNDYVDNLVFDSKNKDLLILDYIPADKNLRFYVNGVFYEENIHYTLDRMNRRLTWKFTTTNGGFDLETRFKYMAVYDIYLEENGLANASQIIQINN